MAEPHTLIIGDEIGEGLYDAFQKIPGTGAIWRSTTPYSSVEYWASKMDDLPRYLEGLAAGPNGGFTPDKMPDTAIVSLGRADLHNEPAKADADGAKRLAENVGKIVDGLAAQKLKVLWIMPPAIPGEGSYRGVMEAALGKKQTRIFPAQHTFTDPSARGKDEAAPIPADTLDQMADLIATWAPLGPPRVPIGPRHEAPVALPGILANMSRPAKLTIAAIVVATLGGAAYAGWRKYG